MFFPTDRWLHCFHCHNYSLALFAEAVKWPVNTLGYDRSNGNEEK